MTTEQLRGMADEAFVEILAQRVVEKLLARQKQALVVYTGSNIGEAAALEAMGYKQELKRAMSVPDMLVYGLIFMVPIAPFGI